MCRNESFRVFKRKNMKEFLIILRNDFQRNEYEKLIKAIKKILKSNENVKLKISIDCSNNDKFYLIDFLEQRINYSIYFGELDLNKEYIITRSKCKLSVI